MAVHHLPTSAGTYQALTPTSSLDDVGATHRWWKLRFMKGARAYIAERQAKGENIAFPESAAANVASYAATDMLLTGRTLLLPMPEGIEAELADERRAA